MLRILEKILVGSETGSGSEKNHSVSTTLSDPYWSLIILKYLTFFWNFFESLINSKDPDLDSEDQLITDSPDPDPKHWSTHNHKSISQTSDFPV
jgi:hypothetical protein